MRWSQRTPIALALMRFYEAKKITDPARSFKA
jgi:hypothetical protein